MQYIPIRSLALLACGLLLGLSGSARSQAPAGLTVEKQQSLPQKMLRGYGSLAARFTLYHDAAGRHASLLTLYAPTPDKAALTLGKYLSDLHELGEVNSDTLTVGAHSVPLSVAPGQGVIAAFRQGATVYIAAAEDRTDVAPLLASTPLGGAGGADFVGGSVPTYLDFFDKYGWGFYYDDFVMPDGQADTYDVRQNYDFAKKNGVTLHYQVAPNVSDTSEGMVNWPRFEAGLDMARQRDIPAYVSAAGKSGPLWVANLFPFEQAMYMPDYVGALYGPGYDAGAYGPSFPGWSSVNASNVQLDMLAPIIRKYSQYPNVAEFMEPHEEMEHATPAVMVDYGPVADAAYRRYLKGKFGTPQAVDGRWYEGAGRIKTWDDVRVPEVAGFLGWGPGAFDLKGVWRVARDKEMPAGDVKRWFAADLDDSKWEQMTAPGDDHAEFRPADRLPAVFRRTFDLPAATLDRLKAAGNGKVYLYIWDMEGNAFTREAALNGASVGTYTNTTWEAAWCAFEVSSNLQAGANQLSLHLPWGELSYKIYLSSHPPLRYPALGPGEDARWVDFRDFTNWTRADGLRRGDEMIRREDKNRTIRNDSAYAVIDVDKAAAEDYGAQFHDTGALQGNGGDYLQGMARSSGIPCTAEPGHPAADLAELKLSFGFWSTEGLNGVDYFINMGNIQWDPQQRAWFEANQPLVHLFGKYHVPRAQVGVMEGAESDHLMGFPWDKLQSELTWGGRSGPVGATGVLPCLSDILVENDFARGNVDRYRVIVDDNTMIMDDALLARIEAWVRAGGIFITYGHSGQHSPLAADTWAISRLTGYKVIGNNDNLGYRVIPGQKILTNPALFATDAAGGTLRLGGAGLLLQKAAPECQNLLAWENGQGIALGVRPLGKGYVVASGTVYSGGPTGTGALVLPDLLRWCGVTTGLPSADGCRVAGYVSNSGLYDVHVLWGQSVKPGTTTTLQVPHAAADTMQDVSTKTTLTGSAAADGTVTFADLALAPLETRGFLTPRHAIATAPLEWLLLQRDWWKGTKAPAPAPPFPTFPNHIDLSMDDSFSPIPADAADLTPYVGAGADDHAWKRLDFGIWSGSYPDVTRAVFRKKFVVPAAWKTGRSWLWINGWEAQSLRPPYKVHAYLDGKPIWESSGQNAYDYLVDDLTAQLTPGPHVLAVEAAGTTSLNGLTSAAWVEHLPEPTLRQSLAGDWGRTADGKPVTLPGEAPLTGARHTFTPLAQGRGKTVMVFGDGHPFLVKGIFINGHWRSRSIGLTRGEHFWINLTPYIKWGQENEIEFSPTYPWPMKATTLELRYYNPGAL